MNSLVEPRVRLPVGGTETKSCVEYSERSAQDQRRRVTSGRSIAWPQATGNSSARGCEWVSKEVDGKLEHQG